MAILIERKLRRRRRKQAQDESHLQELKINDTLLHHHHKREQHFITSHSRMMFNLGESSSSRQLRAADSVEASKVRGASEAKSWPKVVSAICLGGQSLSLFFILIASLLITTSTLNLSAEASPNSANNINNGQQSQQINSYLQQQQQGASPNSVISTPPTLTTSQKPRYKTSWACEDRQLNMDCDYGYKINLIRANFGRFSIAMCNDQGHLDLSTDCKSPITFRIMTERCQDKQKCSVNATSAIFGDKCPKTRKYLEVHFQCQLDTRVSNSDQIEKVDLRNTTTTTSSQPIFPQTAFGTQSHSYGPIQPPNNPSSLINMPPRPSAPSIFDDGPLASTQPNSQPPTTKPQQPSLPQSFTVMNSEMLNYNVIDPKSSYKSSNNSDSSRPDQIVVTFRHTHIENMSNPRCVLWDPTLTQWTVRGAQIIYTNLTHTTCAFDQASHYLLVMDYLAPYPESSHVNPTYYPNTPQQPLQANPIQPELSSGAPIPDILMNPPVPIDSGYTRIPNHLDRLSQNQSNQSRFVTLFWYLLGFVLTTIAFMTVVFIATNMRSSAGAALKSLGNFTAFSGPNYKGRRADGTLNNKDLLVINNQNGHQFLYAPANTTKISSSSSTHILPGTLGHTGTLHQVQQPQLYSGNGTLSNLSGTGGQSNNYYYGLMGLNNLFQQSQQQQQQQLQHHLNQHHLNQQQMNQTSSYLHQANKSTISNESTNSSPSSSGVESGSTSVHNQQQQSCLVMNNDYNLMGHLSNLDQNPLNGAQQPTLILNSHYSSGVVPMNMMQAQQQQRINLTHQNNNSNREHIYESVDDDKAFSGRLLMPEQFNSTTLSQHQSNMMMNNQQNSRALTLSSRMPQNSVLQQQQQQSYQIQQNNNNNNKRLFSHSIIRDNQAKTSIICSKIAQVTPQRATEINKFQHDVMTIYNGHDTITTTTTANSSSSGNSSTCYGHTEAGSSSNGPKLSTDC